MKRPNPYRSWTMAEVKQLQHLREKEGLTWPQIGQRMDLDHNLCRCRYHNQRRLGGA